ncbi:Gfo/Idh/MocA family protein [Jiangella asiatica]|nr:Gfo/Idh/MocA family oxidoreductase [Jiangella asiatica]
MMATREHRPLRTAVLGLGRWGRTWLPVLDREPGVEVVLTAGGIPDGRPLAHLGDYRQALDQPDLDAVVVTLPVRLHLDAVVTAAERGLHVLVEKPAVADRAELDVLCSTAATAPSVVMVCQNYRERAWVAVVRHHLATLGRLSQVSIEVARGEFLDGGRARLPHPLLDDLAIHHLDLLRHLTAQDASVLAATSGRPPWTTYDGQPDVAALLRLDDGAIVTYRGTWAARGGETPYDGDWTLRGENGVIELRDLVVRRDGAVVADTAPRPLDPPDNDLAAVLHTFVAATRGGPVPTSAADHARSLGLVLSMREAAAVGAAVEVET